MSDLNSKHNRVVWVDVPVKDLNRSIAFYSAVLANKVGKAEMGQVSSAVKAALAGWAFTATTAFGQTLPTATSGTAPMTLTFDQAFERALAANASLRATEETVKVGEARVAEATAAFQALITRARSSGWIASSQPSPRCCSAGTPV